MLLYCHINNVKHVKPLGPTCEPGRARRQKCEAIWLHLGTPRVAEVKMWRHLFPFGNPGGCPEAKR